MCVELFIQRIAVRIRGQRAVLQRNQPPRWKQRQQAALPPHVHAIPAAAELLPLTSFKRQDFDASLLF